MILAAGEVYGAAMPQTLYGVFLVTLAICYLAMSKDILLILGIK